MTLEEAQARIVELSEQLTEVTNERDTLSRNNAELTQTNESLRNLNQQYFNKLSQQYFPEDGKKDKEEEAVSCEEFAKTITI